MDLKIPILIFFMASAQCAAAACDLSDYDRVAPPALIGGVDSNSISFEHASDAETHTGDGSSVTTIWNYIKNTGQEDLSIRWPLAGIITGSLRPLPADSIHCNRYSVISAQGHPDDQALIYYGFSETPKPAPVYITGQENDGVKSAMLETIQESAYRGSNGEVIEYRVEITFDGSIASIDVDPEDLNVYISRPLIVSIISNRLKLRLRQLGRNMM